MKTLFKIGVFLCLAPMVFAQEPTITKGVGGEFTTRENKPVTGAIADSAAVLAENVMRASGGDRWPQVKSIDFTFNVAQGEKSIVSVKHHWDIRTGMDEVTSGPAQKTVAVNMYQPGTSPEESEAFKRWTNDSYWLLAPLKLRDKGTSLADQGEQEVEGKTYRVLQLSFESVGLTPRDKYNFYIDPVTNLVARWDHMPTPEKKSGSTWEKYQDFSGLKLATEHNLGGGKRLFFTDVKVTLAD